MTDTCTHRRRSRLATPLALLVGAVLVSGTSAYAAATITGAQIADNSVGTADITNNSLTYADLRDGYVIGNDLQNETITGGKVRNGSLTAAELAPGVANRLADVVAVGGDARSPSSSYTFTSSSAAPMALKKGQRVLVDGYASYFSQNVAFFYVGTCASVEGAPAVTIINADFFDFQGRERMAVNGLYTAAADETVTVGPCAAHGATAPAVAIVPGSTRYTLTVLEPR